MRNSQRKLRQIIVSDSRAEHKIRREPIRIRISGKRQADSMILLFTEAGVQGVLKIPIPPPPQ